MTKRRIVSGIVAAALAIVPFTGTGISSVDKALTKSTAITASAASMRGGLYEVGRQFTAYGPNGGRTFYKGEKISVSDSGMCRGVNVYGAYCSGYLYFICR